MLLKGHLYLVGFSGSGKSTVGKKLAARLKCRFVDIDDEIVRAAGMSIPELFRTKGERTFRSLEAANILSLAKEHGPTVVALGGGALGSPAVRKQVLTEDAVTVYLRCATRELYRRLRDYFDRPLLEVKPKPGEALKQVKLRKIETLLRLRERYYREASMTVSTTNHTPVQVVREIVLKLKKGQA